jgi:hypothetical protein
MIESYFAGVPKVVVIVAFNELVVPFSLPRAWAIMMEVIVSAPRKRMEIPFVVWCEPGQNLF